MSINSHIPEKHIHGIDTSIAELDVLQSRTVAPAPMPHQFVGTVLDNTAVLLTAPANSLDLGGRFATFEHMKNWISVMQAVHRSFYSSILISVEAGLEFICNEHKLAINSHRKFQTDALLDAIQVCIESSPNIDANAHAALKKLRKQNLPRRPEFSDYLETALKASKLDKNKKTQWRKFFQALSIVRNKVSHSDPSLNETEKTSLRGGGFEDLISEDGSLVTNSLHYSPIATSTLNFFDALQLNKP
ncbi:hypothetical protein [Pseudomonas sp. PGPPP2]|uniref:hypothetical protein n=1 Tax=Pseudomonas sp. PGPPP2 TaxID=2015554 RepID=UPI000BD94EA0|nr:hypothetical protein [Pseudomonas sp. PGPPP2]OYT78223.1 MAG: hypothetical protein CFE48_16415 [Pseudomonas sp. PGPPP2]